MLRDMCEEPDKTPTPDLIPLVGARDVRVSEPGEPAIWQDGLIKELTGGEPIRVRVLDRDEQ
jgi:putative DNA primase/helicase